MPPTSQEPPSGKGSSVTLQLGIPPALSLGTRQRSGRKEAPGPAYFHWRGGGGAGHAGSDNFLHLHRHTGLRNVITSKRGQRPSPPTHGGTPPHKGHLAGPEQEAIRSSRVLAVHPTGGCAPYRRVCGYDSLWPRGSVSNRGQATTVETASAHAGSVRVPTSWPGLLTPDAAWGWKALFF